jgi:Ca-activated chloride channel homolog
MRKPTRWRAALAVAAIAIVHLSSSRLHGQEEFRFHSGVELVNVTATITDRDGRFVPGLTLGDVAVYEDGQPVDIALFSADRVPASLGLVLDTSGSMAGEKIANARAAINRFLDRLGPDDEVFVVTFASHVDVAREWTGDLEGVRSTLRRVRAVGGTALYDAVVKAAPIAQQGHQRKKALIVISDGDDTDSLTTMQEVRRVVRDTEVLVYAIGIDGEPQRRYRSSPGSLPPPGPFPIPGPRRPRTPWPVWPQSPPWLRMGTIDRLNVAALRQITDDSGGRTEIVREARDLDPVTASIADELSRQYYLGYVSPAPRDGHWHTIRVETRDSTLRVRARRGYVAS